MIKKYHALQERLTPSSPRLRWGFLGLGVLLTGLGWSALSTLLLTQSFRRTFAALATPAFWFTALFFLLLTALFTLLTRSLFAGGLISWFPFLIFGLINYFKLSITGAPFLLDDLALTGNVGGIISLNLKSLVPSRNTVLAVVLTLLWLLVLWFFSRPLRPRSWRLSLPLALAPLVLLVAVFWVWVEPLVFTPLGVQQSLGNMGQSIFNDRCGLPLGLLRTARWNGRSSAPVDSSYLESLLDQAQSELGETPAADPDAVHPNVILLLSESFFDVTTIPGVTYDQDPIPEFHALQKESVSGTFQTRTLGYGTSNIELEVLTGINTHLIANESLYTLDPELFRRLPAIPRLLDDAGYRTVMLHTFNDGIYHRDPKMAAIGFQERYFSSDFAAIDPDAAAAPDYYGYLDQFISGTFYSDSYLTDLIIDLYENNTSGKPLFAYGISMEGHTPYDSTKYAPGELTVSFDAPLSDEARQMFTMYSQAASNASAALDKLVNYFRDADQPTVIVFFGDHRPGLGLEGSTTESVYSQIYSALGTWGGGKSAEEYSTLCSTSYLIWANDPSLLPAQPGETKTESSNYMGLALLDAANVPKPLYWRLLQQLSETRVIDAPGYSLGRDGTLTLNTPTEGLDHERLARFAHFLRDALYQNQLVTKSLWE